MKKTIIVALFIALSSIGAAFVSTAPAFAAPDTCDVKGRILTLKPWYWDLDKENPPSDCSVKSPGPSDDDRRKFINQIAFNIVEDLLHIVGYVAVGFIIYGGFTFLTSGGMPQRSEGGRKTVFNASIGLVIAMASIGLVNLVRSMIGL